jgi:hypothetical protein
MNDEQAYYEYLRKYYGPPKPKIYRSQDRRKAIAESNRIVMAAIISLDGKTPQGKWIGALSDAYIRRLLHLRKKDCPPELIALKREYLKLWRLTVTTKT